MMSDTYEYSNTMEITPIKPIQTNGELIGQLGITHILSCVDRRHIDTTQNKILEANPNVVILSLPYRDDTEQDLWLVSNKNVSLVKCVRNPQELIEMKKTVTSYRGKPLIEIGYNFMDEALRSGGKVLVHCMAGISRSTSVLAYYLMKKNFDNYDTVIDYVRSKRPIINPNLSFRLQLNSYDAKRDQYTTNDSKTIINQLRKQMKPRN
jgi:protein-tyrosine phosphatase